MNRIQMTNRWLEYAAKKAATEAVFLAGVGLLNDQDGAAYYANVGFPALLVAAEGEVNGQRVVRQELEPLRKL